MLQIIGNLIFSILNFDGPLINRLVKIALKSFPPLRLILKYEYDSLNYHRPPIENVDYYLSMANGSIGGIRKPGPRLPLASDG